MARRLGPGAWVDEKGDLHFSVPELLDLFGLPHDAEHEAEIRREIHEVLQQEAPGAPVVEVDSCPHCGLRGAGVHGQNCRWAGEAKK